MNGKIRKLNPEEVMPCPFCGEKDLYSVSYNTPVGERFKITYGNCGIECDNGCCPDEGKAKLVFNNHPLTPDIIDKISQELQDAGFEDASKWLDCKYEL